MSLLLGRLIFRVYVKLPGGTSIQLKVDVRVSFIGVVLFKNVARFVASQKDQEEPEAPGEGVGSLRALEKVMLPVDVNNFFKKGEL